jgi:signal peptide peptidase SppA
MSGSGPADLPPTLTGVTRSRPLAHLVSRRPWAILEDDPAWAMIRGIAAGTVALELDDEAFRAKAAAASFRERLGAVRAGNVEIIPVHGVITQRYTWLTWLLDGTALEWLREAIREAIADSDVAAVVLDIDSPGGSVDGLPEFGADLRAMRESGGKPIVSVVDPMMASAALWIGAQASEVVLTPSGMAGSVGVVMIHVDESRWLDAAGLTITLIHSGEFKVEGNPFEPLGDEALARLQVESDHYYGMFIGELAKGRGVPASAVRDDFGQGRMLLPAEAMAAGMIDKVDTLENTVRRLARGRQATSRGRAAADGPAPLAGDIADPALPVADESIDPAEAEPAAADTAPTSLPPRQPDQAWVRANAAAFDRAVNGAPPRWYD